MSKDELLRERKKVIYILLVVFAIGFFTTFFIMDIPNIYFGETYTIKINGERNGRGIDLYKKRFSDDAYMYASGCKEFHPNIVVEKITVETETVTINHGYGAKYTENKATITVCNTATGESFNLRGAARNNEDTVPYVNVSDAMSMMGYEYDLNSVIKTISVTTD